MRSDDEDSGDDDEVSSEPSHGLGNDRKVAATKVVRKSAPQTLKNGDLAFKYQTILDSGTEWTIFGRPAWTISCIHKRGLNIAVVDSQLPSVKTSLCDAMLLNTKYY